MIACTHPGKIGDTLYALPTAKKLYELTGEKVDFYTSEYCKPLEKLIKYQRYINDFFIPPNYKVERMDMGVQPWKMPVDLSLYSKVYHLGFRRIPDIRLDYFIGHEAGINPSPISYDFPKQRLVEFNNYIVIAPRGQTSYIKLFQDIAEKSKMQVVEIGGKGDWTGSKNSLDYTGLDFLDTLDIIAFSKGFVGLMSSQLVLANGFDIPKVIPHDGRSWDMRHVVYSDLHHYVVNPTVEGILDILGC